MKVKVVQADYNNAKHSKDITLLLNSYALDPMGGGKALTDYTVNNLTKELAKLPHAFSVLCYADDKAVGLINCFEAFSTFTCAPLVNIHDVAVLKEHRGFGLSHKMLEKVEEIAKTKGCCKITLEVLNGNEPAKSSYAKFGFTSYELDPTHGQALFLQKVITPHHK